MRSAAPPSRRIWPPRMLGWRDNLQTSHSRRESCSARIAIAAIPNRETMNDVTRAAAIRGEEHWTRKDGDVKLFMFEKCAGDPNSAAGTILFVHGSSMASQPTFDLQVDGRPDSSVTDWFARHGFDCWCVDMVGYGRSTKDRANNAPIAPRAIDC